MVLSLTERGDTGSVVWVGQGWRKKDQGAGIGYFNSGILMNSGKTIKL